MTEIHVFDDIMDPFSHQKTWEFLEGPGWRFGAYSDDHPDADKYWFKHFAGYSASGVEERDPVGIAEELRSSCLPLYKMWEGIVASFLPRQLLGRCYANRMPPGIGGGLHRDSLVASHLTAIYYPHLEWSPRDAGEVLFYDDAERDVVRAVAPRPNRLVVFSGTIPHVARPISNHAKSDRISLVFKTLGIPVAGVAGGA